MTIIEPREPLLLLVVVWVLAAYHLAMGAIALVSPRLAMRLAGSLYGATLGDSPQLRYATAMIGALALTVGVLAATAAHHPLAHRPTLAVLLVLQAARLFCRIRDRRLLASAFGVTPRRNALAAAVLGLEIVILSVALR